MIYNHISYSINYNYKYNEVFQTAMESLIHGNTYSTIKFIFMNQLYILYYTDPNPAYELFVFDENQVGLIYQLYENENLFLDYFRNGSSPFALDKRNRIVFYTGINNDIYRIWKGNIDDPVIREVCSHITNLCMCIILYIRIYIIIYILYIYNNIYIYYTSIIINYIYLIIIFGKEN